MTDEEKKAIEDLKEEIKGAEYEKQQDRINKVMDYMVDRIEWLMKSNGIGLDFEHKDNFTKEDIKEYFYRKVENNE